MDDPPRARILAVLPPEVLHRIFEFAGEDAYSVQREAMRIARVCHEFQHVFSLYPIRHWALKSENEILTLSAKVVALEEARVSGEGGDETMNSLEVFALDIVMHQQPLYDAWISATYLLLTAPFKNLRKLRIDITPSFDTERILDAYCRESLVNAIESLEYLDELVVTIGSAKSVPLFQGIHRALLNTPHWDFLANGATLPSNVRSFTLSRIVT